MEIQIQSIFPIFLTLSLFVFILIKVAKTSNHSAPKLPPGPWKLPLLGNIHQLVGDVPHRALSRLAERHGPLMHLKFGQVPTVVISSPDLAKEVMKTHDAIFAFRPKTVYSEILLYDCMDIAFAPYGEYWRNLRKICTQELLSSARVQSFKAIREEEFFGFVDWIGSNAGLVIDLTDRIRSTIYGVTSRAAFGEKSARHNEFVSVVLEVVEAVGGFEIAELFPSFRLLSLVSGTRRKLEDLKRRGSRIMDGIIDDHRSKDRVSSGEDLVDVLLKYHDADNDEKLGFSLTIDNIKAVIWDIFSAGSETSGTTLEWAMAELMKNPLVMKKAQDEVREVFRRKGSVDETFISEMKYLKSVVKETLRLHPSTPLLLPRECSRKCEIRGYEIPKKTRVLVNAWAIGRNPSYWTQPESFAPERFLDSAIDFKGLNFEYIPFGAGRRICPEILFGMFNVEVPLAMLLYHFDWKLPDGITPEEFDMTEDIGVTVGRKHRLKVIPIAYDVSPIHEKFKGKITK